MSSNEAGRLQPRSFLWVRSLDPLWNQVQDMMVRFGDYDVRLGTCMLEEIRDHGFVLHVPDYLIGLAEKNLNSMEDALEQIIGEHAVPVYPVGMGDDLSRRLFLWSPCAAFDVL